jgi:hypothetical protein
MGTLATVGQSLEQQGGVKTCWETPETRIHLSPFSLTAIVGAGLKQDGDTFSIAMHDYFSSHLLLVQNEVYRRPVTIV